MRILANKLRVMAISLFVCTNSLYANNSLSDPTKPADYQDSLAEPIYVEAVTVDEKVSWRVSAIRISSSDRTAIVNGELVRVGDEISSGEVIEINPLSVVLNHKDQKLIVRLFNSNVKKEVAN